MDREVQQLELIQGQALELGLGRRVAEQDRRSRRPMMRSTDRASSSAEGSGRSFVGSRSSIPRVAGLGLTTAVAGCGEELTARVRVGRTARFCVAAKHGEDRPGRGVGDDVRLQQALTRRRGQQLERHLMQLAVSADDESPLGAQLRHRHRAGSDQARLPRPMTLHRPERAWTAPLPGRRSRCAPEGAAAAVRCSSRR